MMTPSIGINPYSVNDGSADQTYADCIKHARQWARAVAPYDSTNGVAVDAAGWPLTDCSVLPVSGINIHGTYTLRFKGISQFSLNSTTGVFHDQLYDEPTNSSILYLDVPAQNTGLVSLFINNTQRNSNSALSTGITNFSMMRPTFPGSSVSHNPSELFSRNYLSFLGPFGPIRDLDLAVTNNCDANPYTWSRRALPSWPILSTIDGIPLEHKIALCNAIGSDLHITIPDTADDDYVTKTYQMCKNGSDGVNPYTVPTTNPVWAPLAGRLIFQYSNEVWNYTFSQAIRNFNAAAAEVAAGGSKLNWDGSTNAYYFAARRNAEQTLRLRNLAVAVYGESGFGTTFFPYLAGQQDNLDVLGQALEYLDQSGTTTLPVNQIVTHGGSGWYRGFVEKSVDSSITADAVFASGIEPAPWTAQNQTLCDQYGILQGCYEGGLDYGESSVNALTLAARLDPRIAAPTAQAINDVLAGGANFANIYSSTLQNWGLTDSVSNVAAPKYTATTGTIPSKPGPLMTVPVIPPATIGTARLKRILGRSS